MVQLYPMLSLVPPQAKGSSCTVLAESVNPYPSAIFNVFGTFASGLILLHLLYVVF